MPRAFQSKLSLLVVLAALTGPAPGPGKSSPWWTAVPAQPANQDPEAPWDLSGPG